MIVIHINILKYPATETAERVPVFSKCRILNILGSQINRSITIDMLLYGILLCQVFQEL